MSVKLRYSEEALKCLKRLPKNEHIKVTRNIDKLKELPFSGKKLEGELAIFRSLRVWPYRVIYEFVQEEKMIVIHSIKHRQEAYK